MSNMVNKVTLDSGKIVVLANLEIRHYRQAAESAAHRANNNQLLFNLYVQDEILKVLLISIDEKILSAGEKEMIDKNFSTTDYNQLMSVIVNLIGKTNPPKVELVSM